MMQETIKDKINKLHLKDALLSFTTFENTVVEEELVVVKAKGTTTNQIRKLLEKEPLPILEIVEPKLIPPPPSTTPPPKEEEPYDPRPLFQRLASIKERDDERKEEYHKSLNTQKAKDDQEFMFNQMDEVYRLETIQREMDATLLASFRKDVKDESDKTGLINMKIGDEMKEFVSIKRVNEDKLTWKVGMSIQKKVKVDDVKSLGLVAYDSDSS